MRLEYYPQIIKEILNKYIYAIVLQTKNVYMLTETKKIQNTLYILKNNSIINGETLIDIIAVDNNQNKRFSLTYTMWNYKNSIRYYLKTYLNQWAPINSVTKIFSSAGWLEREIWDMYGIKFLNHPDLRRILTDYGFQGYPLRKDFPLMGYLEVRYEDSLKTIIMEPVELAQNFRYFRFENKWEK